MLGLSINLFRIRGIQLSLHASFLLLVAYYANEGYHEGGYLVMGWSVVMLLAFFTCVVLHELGHSFTARHFGVNVRRILLMPIGGMAEFDSIPRQPSRELLITLAGPAVNFVIAGLLWLAVDYPAAWDPGAYPTSLSELGCTLLAWNLVMGAFNLIPVFPMDGGRILRALLAIKLPYLRATYWAAVIGRVLAVIGVVVALYFHAYLLAVLFTFIAFAGNAEYRSVLRRDQEDAQWRTMMERLQSQPPAPEPPLLKRNNLPSSPEL